MIAPFKKLFQKWNPTDPEFFQHLEETLLLADAGVKATTRLIDEIKKEKNLESPDSLLSLLKQKIIALLTPISPWQFPSTNPAVFIFVGVNGTGKTTTVAKMAAFFLKQKHQPLLVGADTFRAAAGAQLEMWAKKLGVDTVGSEPQADSASVVCDGIRAAKARGCDLVLVDTAGRLHTKTNLMEELKKGVRVAKKELQRNPDEIFLVLDATLGQNSLLQAKLFKEHVGVTGVILTKYDGTAKGGILLSVVEETALPICFVGVGEGENDLKPFVAKEFVEALFSC